MALTRKFLKALGIEDDKIEQIIEEHTTIADRMNAEIAKYKPDAEKLKAVQKELDDLKAAGDDGFEAKYNAEKKAFADYKAEVTAKETKAAKEKAVRAYFESKNIEGANLNIAMRSSGAEIDAVVLEDGKIKDTAALDALVNGDYAGLVSQPSVRVDMGARLNNTGKPMTKQDILAIKDPVARQTEIAKNLNLFQS